MNTSPDYIEEKSVNFFGQLGRSGIVEFLSKKHEKFYMGYWFMYCERWGVQYDNFELLNVILFIIYDRNKENIIKLFEKYIGNTDIITNLDKKCLAHIKVLNYIDNTIDFNSRYFKLKTL